MKKHILTAIIVILVFSCQKGPTESVEMSDAELIQLIIDAVKIDIALSEIPVQSQTILQSNYEYDALGAKKASGLGYEVDLTGCGRSLGDRKEFYFNLEGRKLDPYDYGKDRDKDNWEREGEEDWKCFDLILPVTFIMPDSSIVTVASDDEAGWEEVKAWYEANSDVDERPALQFPVDISFGEDRTITVNNEEEMKGAYRYCRKDGFDANCGAVVFPVTYNMSDGSTITIESEDDYGLLREWQINNPDNEGEPTIQYPIDVIFRVDDGEITVTINSDGEYIDAKDQYCSSGRD
tara:strand:+ start:15217 stop:16095 length:879 start_codon:yes stop_codon:yes gene_type:complete